MRSGVRAIALAVVFGALAGCTAGVTTEVSEPIRPATSIATERIALLPVTTEPGSEDAAPVISDALTEYLGDVAPGLTALPPAETRDRIGHAGLAGDLSSIFADYDRTGVADPGMLDRVADAAGAEWLLQVRIAYTEGEVTRDDPLDDDVVDERRRDVRMVARLWRANSTAPTWEGTVRAGSETGIFLGDLPDRYGMLVELTHELIDRIPLAR